MLMWLGLRENPRVQGKEGFGVGGHDAEVATPEMARVKMTVRAARLWEGIRWQCISGMCSLGIWSWRSRTTEKEGQGRLKEVESLRCDALGSGPSL